MKKIFKSATVVSLAILALSMSACTKDEPTGRRTEESQVTLALRTRPMSSVSTSTRAGETDETVANVAVFGVDADGKVAQTFDLMQPSAGSVSLSVIGSVKDLYVIANPKGEHTLNYKNIDEIFAERIDYSAPPALPLVMAGKVGVASRPTLQVDMTRAVAKLTVKSGDESNFNVNSLVVTKTPNYTNLFEQSAIPAFEDDEYVSYPEIDGNIVYVGENNADNATRLTVKGTYKGKPVVYNTTLQKNLTNIAIKRNTSYVLTLSPISETDFTVDVIIDTWGDDQVLDDGYFVPHGTYYSVDFHNHTQFTDGANRLMFVLNQGKKYDLDIIVNSEHGGSSSYNAAAEGEWNGQNEYLEGSTSPRWNDWISTTGWDGVRYGSGNNMWRWQTIRDFSWPTLQKFNTVNGTSILAVQGLEWNPPGHEHCSVGVITGQFDGGNNADAQAQFEYMFDNSDTDIEGGAAQGWKKSTKSGHAKSLEAAAWLQKYHPRTSYMVPAHPERQNKWTISDYRDMNNTAPDVFVAFESLPGHQASTGRGGYGTSAYPNGMGANKADALIDGTEDSGLTRGGAGYQSAIVGGLWDAMLSEGRHFWLVANSDFHNHVSQNDGDFYPGEYQKTYISMNDHSAQGFVDGLRSGNIYNVHGDLIKDLQFSVSSATMGQTLVTDKETVRVKIVVRDPDTANNNGDNPKLDHIDVIAGKMRERVQPGTAEYSKGMYEHVKVVKRFAAEGGHTDANNIVSEAWVNQGDGIYTMEFDYELDGSTYFRLRGTNQPMVGGEVDENGNPLIDPQMSSVQLQAEAAWKDLWLYSNPIFVKQLQ